MSVSGDTYKRTAKTSYRRHPQLPGIQARRLSKPEGFQLARGFSDRILEVTAAAEYADGGQNRERKKTAGLRHSSYVKGNRPTATD